MDDCLGCRPILGHDGIDQPSPKALMIALLQDLGEWVLMETSPVETVVIVERKSDSVVGYM